MQSAFFLLIAIMLSLSSIPQNAYAQSFTRINAASFRAMVDDGKELAILDPREEGVFGQAHLLLAANVPLSRLELRIESLVPRKTTRMVLVDGGEGIAERAAAVLHQLGYTAIAILDGGYPAWKAAGHEIFDGMNVPGKAFGEWVAVTYGTPTITPQELHKRIAAGEEVLLLDARPANEYTNMSIPGAINVPGSELVYRFPELAVKPGTLVVVNCAGRTRSLIGAQTLINAGVKNEVVALRGGTMAWQMAGFDLEYGSTRHAPEPWGKDYQQALQMAQAVANRFGVKTIDAATLERYKAEAAQRTLYLIDVRTPEEYRAGHRPDTMFAWGVQVVQGIDKYAATRNARVVLVDNYLVRALMTASWMVQQGWPDTFVLADPFAGVALETGEHPVVVPGVGEVKLPRIDPAALNRLLVAARRTIVFDVADSLAYKKGHIPGAYFVIRSRLAEALKNIPGADNFVVTGDDPDLVALAARDLAKISGGKTVSILAGGNAAWRKATLPVTAGFEHLASPPDDIFRQPFLWGHYEPMSPEFKQAALDYFQWELQLPEQLERASETHFYQPAQKAEPAK